MSWNTDNTVWNPVYPGSSSNPYHKLTHEGNGKWRMVSAAVGDMVESDGGSEDFDDGHMFVLWVTGEIYKAKSNDNYPHTAWYQARWNGSAWVQGSYGGGLSQHYPYLEYTFSGNGPARIYVGYAGYGTGFQSNGRGTNAYNTSNIVSNSVAGTPFPFAGSFPNSFSNSFYIDIPEINPDNPQDTGATHRVNVNARNVDHWSWSLDGGPDNMMPPGSTYVDITVEPEPETFNTPTYGVKLQLKNWITARLGHTDWTCIDLQRCGHLEPVTWSGITIYPANSWITEVPSHPSTNTTTVQESHLNYGIQNCISDGPYDNKAQMYQAVKVTLDNEGDRVVIIPVENYYNNAVTVSSYDGITS